MKLHSSTNSPYVRKVMVTAHEIGLVDRLAPVPADTRVADGTLASPINDLPEVNPLAAIPTLVAEDGESLYDSRVICAYLDTLHDGPRICPAEGPARWRALCREALADGMTYAAYLVMLEGRRPEDARLPSWIDHQWRKVVRGLDGLEGEAAGFGDELDIGLISVACTLGFLDHRFAAQGWRSGRPRLAGWFGGVSRRPSMIATTPRDE